VFELGSWDVENDEAIYTYAVERMIDTGDWMTARDPNDFAFLEKPPLALDGRPADPARLLPRSELRLSRHRRAARRDRLRLRRLFGYRLAGPAAAIASCLLLFGLRDLVLVHGIRSNNMEASLGGALRRLLLPCAGGTPARDGTRSITGAWFTLAFLTKFVAAAFLPLVAVVGLALPRPGLLPSRSAPASPTGCGRRCSSSPRRPGSSEHGSSATS
jgi:hypothetical protein